MDDKQKADLIASTPLAWILFNKFVNENQETIEFSNHRFMIDFYADNSDDIVSRKSAQVGFSVAAILKSLHHAKYRSQNIIYVLPTRDVVDGFVVPKVNPLITSNAKIADMVGDDSKSLKKVGDRFIYFRGAFNDRQAINISGDVLVLDEYDRMPDMSVVNTFDSRLQAAKDPKRWRFSNPSTVGFGVDGLYNESDQLHWFVRCSHCNHYRWMEWEQNDDQAHYINRDKGIYACGKCHKEIYDADRRNGEWIAKYPTRKRRGYWFSQMMAPWVTAKRIIEQYEESNIEFFHNFVLGKAYTPSDMVVDRQAILRACAPSNIERKNVVIGVDQNVNNQIWVAGTPEGIFAYGKYDSWEEMERLKLMYNAIMVCDPNPYPTKPKQLADKYRDVYLCYFRPQEGMNIIKRDGQKVTADRTRLLDMVANDIVEARLLFRQRPQELEDYIADWNNIYRTTVEQPDGRTKSDWLKKEGRNSDYSFATAYYRIGLSFIIGSESRLLEPEERKSTIIGDTGIGNVVSDTLKGL